MKKILVLVMALALICGMMVSCNNAQSLLEKADAALEKEPYGITMKMSFECDNEELNQVLSLMNIEIPTTVDGKNIAMDMSMDMMGYTFGTKVIVADMVMYYDMELMGQNIKMKATMDEEQYQEFMAENNTQMMIKPEDFGELTVETKDGKKYIVCDGISEEALKALNGMVAENLVGEGIDGEATFVDVTYCVTLNNGKYESMDMICVYSLTVAGVSCNVTFNLSAAYSYDNIAEITAPADADEYEELSFGDLMG